jgi:pyruvate formate lyase activating enzyme
MAHPPLAVEVAGLSGQPVWRTAILGEPAGERVRCTLCPHRCALADGETGLCRVRRRSGEELQTATFGTTTLHVDPIERKPFYHYRPGTPALTLAAPGCTFLCSYCVNYRVSQYGRPAGQPWSAEPVDVSGVVTRAASLGAAVALSYSEPALAIELTLALAEAAREAGVEVVWKSNGFLTPAAVDVVAPALAAVNIDVKAPDEDRHRRLTGGALAPILETVTGLRERGVWVEVSTPLIPGVSADPVDLAAIARRLAAIDTALPWHLLRFTPTFRMADHVPTAPARLAEAVDIGRRAGLRYVYVERALGPAGRTTLCGGCGAAVVRRGVWSTESVSLVNGACHACGRMVEGRW